MGRATQGVRLINLRDEDAIASVAKVEADEAVDSGEMESDSSEISTETQEN
jgi:DNA gyrase subunit A